MKPGLPVADSATTRRELGTILRRHRGQFILTITLFALGSAAGLAAPYLLGVLIDSIDDGGTSTVDAIALAVAGCAVLQALLVGTSHFISNRLGETVMARLREDFVRRCLKLPLPVVEKAGTGDLMTRSSRDVHQLGQVLRRAAPEVLINLLTVTLTLVALAIASPILAGVALLSTVPLLWGPVRWYLRRARDAYIAENSTYSDIAENLAATVEGASTVEATGTQQQRIRRGEDDIAASYRAEKGTLRLRTVLFPALDFGVTFPVATVLLTGAVLYSLDAISLGAATAAVLYTNQVSGPIFTLMGFLDELQVGDASLGRIIGVGDTGDTTRSPATERRTDNHTAVRVDQLRYAYSPGKDVLHDIDLEVPRGQRLAIVGPSGAGKSTLGRLIAGIDAPSRGRVTVCGWDVGAVGLDQLRREVLLVTQEHHVFLGTLRDNLALANPQCDDDGIRAALAAVDADGWLAELPDGLDTEVGSAAVPVSAAQAQQIALARLVLADPQVLVLDEATSLLDPRAARDLERHLAAVLSSRTVIAIAHRLHTAHDADRIAVVDNGKIAELGSHDFLVRQDGQYARLWKSWQNQ